MVTTARTGAANLWRATMRIADLSFGGLLWSRRTLFLAGLVGLPVVLAAVVRIASLRAGTPVLLLSTDELQGTSLFGTMVWVLYVRFIVPMLGVLYGTALVADEVEQRTLTYLFVRPVPKASVLLGKYVAYLACTTLLLLPTVTLVFFLTVPLDALSVAQAFPALLADQALLVVGLAAYGACFAAVGAAVRRPLVAGLVFVLGWEPTALLIPGYLGRLTLGYYLQGMVPHPMPPDESGIGLLLQGGVEVLSPATSAGVLLLVTVGALWVGSRVVAAREYVLEQ